MVVCCSVFGCISSLNDKTKRKFYRFPLDKSRCQAVQNMGLATVLILAGVIVDKYGYLMLEMFFLGCLFVSLIAAVLIYIVDSANNGILNMSPSMRDSVKLASLQSIVPSLFCAANVAEGSSAFREKKRREDSKMAKVQTHSEMSLSAPIPVPQEEDIDLLALTMAALRFVNPWTVQEAKPQWTDRIVPGTPEAKDRIITLAELSHHDTPNDCWVVIYDRVYDISTFLDEHPGGAEIMLEYAGRDASTAFRGSGHSRMASKALERFLVGELPMNERMYRRPGGIRLSDIPE